MPWCIKLKLELELEDKNIEIEDELGISAVTFGLIGQKIKMIQRMMQALQVSLRGTLV
jgi:hypothetical protein